jgi:hypothetical protein
LATPGCPSNTSPSPVEARSSICVDPTDVTDCIESKTDCSVPEAVTVTSSRNAWISSRKSAVTVAPAPTVTTRVASENPSWWTNSV